MKMFLYEECPESGGVPLIRPSATFSLKGEGIERFSPLHEGEGQG